jgi:hypothetical protein
MVRPVRTPRSRIPVWRSKHALWFRSTRSTSSRNPDCVAEVPRSCFIERCDLSPRLPVKSVTAVPGHSRERSVRPLRAPAELPPPPTELVACVRELRRRGSELPERREGLPERTRPQIRREIRPRRRARSFRRSPPKAWVPRFLANFVAREAPTVARGAPAHDAEPPRPTRRPDPRPFPP